MKEKILAQKVAVVTGANQGLGFEIARKFAKAGASLMLVSRNASLLKDVTRELEPLCSPDQHIYSFAGDVSDPSSVESIANETIDKFGACHILVNNAGVYGPKGLSEEVDWKEWIRAFEINVYGSVLMSRAIVPQMKRQGYGKIIQLSGGGATNPLPRISAYAASKAAIVRFTETLAEELRGSGVDVNSIAPGALNTKMLDEILEAGPSKVGSDFYARALKQKESGGAPLEVGADLCLFLASSYSDGITAKLISAVWDDWEEWPNHLEELNSSDVYTLRRIVGRDRNYLWGDK
jgi:3-oxoacyl-[acyl-carrier protein] reductase